MKRIAIAVVVALLVASCGEAGVDETPAPGAATTMIDDGTAVSTSTPVDADPQDGQEEVETTVATSLPPVEDDSRTEDTVSDSTTPPTREERPPTTKTPERVPAEDTGEPMVGEVPDTMMQEIFAHAAEYAGAPDTDFTVVRAEFVVWSDGSLGCAEPGMVYTQAPVDGYWIVLDRNGVEYDYRAAAAGGFHHCENPSLGPPGTVPNQ